MGGEYAGEVVLLDQFEAERLLVEGARALEVGGADEADQPRRAENVWHVDYLHKVLPPEFGGPMPSITHHGPSVGYLRVPPFGWKDQAVGTTAMVLIWDTLTEPVRNWTVMSSPVAILQEFHHVPELRLISRSKGTFLNSRS